MSCLSKEKSQNNMLIEPCLYCYSRCTLYKRFFHVDFITIFANDTDFPATLQYYIFVPLEHNLFHVLYWMFRALLNGIFEVVFKYTFKVFPPVENNQDNPSLALDPFANSQLVWLSRISLVTPCVVC